MVGIAAGRERIRCLVVDDRDLRQWQARGDADLLHDVVELGGVLARHHASPRHREDELVRVPVGHPDADEGDADGERDQPERVHAEEVADGPDDDDDRDEHQAEKKPGLALVLRLLLAERDRHDRPG